MVEEIYLFVFYRKALISLTSWLIALYKNIVFNIKYNMYFSGCVDGRE